MKALSLRQPWAWSVIHAGKRVENRTWNTAFRGEFLIHAAKSFIVDEVESSLRWIAETFDVTSASRKYPLGGIVAVAVLDGVLRPGNDADRAALLASRFVDLRWHMPEQYGFVLRDVRPTPFIPCRGMQGFFPVDAAIATAALEGAERRRVEAAGVAGVRGDGPRERTARTEGPSTPATPAREGAR